ncbi:uncharacterized protein [Drosophila virilis]|uniref:Uncharacterized protein, isoform B n=1 Tax=Drosophila virilis TaxID=7244 RepID=A0A0Q9WLL9_DROVI|nr:uncharacterized protein LOC6627687 isoform X2 [Drosophila virilis]KRF81774.1 uncharacterized protein Dvir_GJ21236, isoform B [Drosophila virilis]
MLQYTFTDEVTEFIIERVHAEEYLWNPANPLYKVRPMKNDFWVKLTEDINTKYKPNTPVTQADVCRKWNNLKSYYKYMYQKSALDDWKNKSKMDFLLQLITSRPGPNTSTRSSVSKLEISDESSFHTEDSFYANDIESPPVVTEWEKEQEEVPAATKPASTSFPDTTSAANAESPQSAKRARASNDGALNITAVNSIAPAVERSTSEPSELFHYGNFIVQSITRLDRDLQIKAKKLLTNVVLDLETEQMSRDMANK